jgi:outer membrane protein assembly factor BamB
VWSADNNLNWKVDIPGRGWACPIIANGKVLVATAVSEGDQNRESMHSFELHCIDLASGSTDWKQVAAHIKPPIGTHRDNTYASETPVTDGERIVVYFGMVGVYCYDFDGQLLWKNEDLGAYEMQNDWGTSSSPAMHDGMVFLQIDNEEDSFLVALDAADGAERWRVPREESSNWCSPVIWTNRARTELVTAGGKVRSYDPTSGEILWELNLGGGRLSASPAGTSDFLIVGAENRGGGRRGGRRRGGGGGGDGQNAQAQNADGQRSGGGQRGGGRRGGGGGGGGLFAVRAGAAGDVTPPEGTDQSDGVVWVNRGAGPGMASPLIYDGYVYLLARRGGIVSCFDASTGEEKYQERLPGAQEFWASPWAFDGKIFCPDASGATHVLAPGSEFKVLDSNELEGRFWASSAVADGAIVLRSEDALFCVAKAQ